VVVHDLDILRSAVSPEKAHAELVVDPRAPLPGSITIERFKLVSRRGEHVMDAKGKIQLFQFAQRRSLNVHETLHPAKLEQLLGIGALEGLDGHGTLLTNIVINGERYYVDLRRNQ
jgi:hypothetical protein